MQSDVAVGTDAITGTLAFIEGGLSPAGYLSGDGWFLSLKFSTDNWNDFDKVEIGLDPSQGSGLVDILPDPDKNMVAKITSTSQKFVVKTTIGESVETKEYSLAGLVLTPAPAPWATELVVMDMNNHTITTPITDPDVTHLDIEDTYGLTGLVAAAIKVDDAYEVSEAYLNNVALTLTVHTETGYYSYGNLSWNTTPDSSGNVVNSLRFVLEDKNDSTNTKTYTATVTKYATVDPQLLNVGFMPGGSVNIQEGVYSYTVTGQNNTSELLYINTVDTNCTVTRFNNGVSDIQLTRIVDSGRYQYLPSGSVSIADGATATIVTEDAHGNSLTYSITYREQNPVIDPQISEINIDGNSVTPTAGTYNYTYTSQNVTEELQYINTINNCFIDSCMIENNAITLNSSAISQGGTHYTPDTSGSEPPPMINDGDTLTIVTHDNYYNEFTYNITYQFEDPSVTETPTEPGGTETPTEPGDNTGTDAPTEPGGTETPTEPVDDPGAETTTEPGGDYPGANTEDPGGAETTSP